MRKECWCQLRQSRLFDAYASQTSRIGDEERFWVCEYEPFLLTDLLLRLRIYLKLWRQMTILL